MKSLALAIVFAILSGVLFSVKAQEQTIFEDTTGIFQDIRSIDTLIISGQMAEVQDKITRYKQSNLVEVHQDAYHLLLAFSTRFYLITGNYKDAEREGEKVHEAIKDITLNTSRNYYIGRIGTLWYAYTLKEMGEFQEAMEVVYNLLDRMDDRPVSDTRPFLSVIADIYMDLGDYDQAISLFTEQLNNTPSNYNRAILHNNLGLAYEDLERYEVAVEHYLDALAINRELNNVRDMAANYNNLFNGYTNLGEKELALEYARKGLLMSKKHGLKSSEVRLLYNIADQHISDNQIDSAFVYLRKSLNLATEMNIPEGIYYNNFGMGEAFFALDQFSQAETYYRRAYEFAKAGGRKLLAMEALEPLFNINEIQGDFARAYQYQKEYLELNSDVMDEERLKTIERLQVQYEVQQKERETEFLAQQVELQEASLSMQNRISWMLGFGFLITGGFLAYIYQQNRKLTMSYEANEEARKVIQQQKADLETLDAEKSTLINIVVHDIKNPLNAIMGFINLLEDDPDLAKSDHVMKQISNATKQTEFLVNDLVNLNFLESFDKEIDRSVVEVKEVVLFATTTVANQADSKHIRLVEKLSESATVYSNSTYLTRVCQNLLTNAIKFSKPGSQVLIGGEEKESYYELYVEDHGPGFTEEDKQKLFAKYERLSAKPTANETGTGLGLYIVKMICDHLDISIHLETEPTKGSRFTLRIPRQK